MFWEDYLTSVGIKSAITTPDSVTPVMAKTVKPNRAQLNWEILGAGMVAIGRFVASFALLWLCPRIVLTGALIGCTITSGLAITQTGRKAAVILILNRLFQACTSLQRLIMSQVLTVF